MYKKRDNFGTRQGTIKAPTMQVIPSGTSENLNAKLGTRVVNGKAPVTINYESYYLKDFLQIGEDLSRFVNDAEGNEEANYYTSIAIGKVKFAVNLTSGMKLAIRDGFYSQPITLTADVNVNDTTLSVSSFQPVANLRKGSCISIDQDNLMNQYQKKTEGEIAGFTINSTSLTKGGISINGFLDSDTMSGASATTLPTSESVKAYVDSQSGGSVTSNFKSYKCSTTTTTSATAGESNAVVIPFDTQITTSTSTNITFYGSTGPAELTDGAYSFSMGTGNFLICWNVGTNTNIVNNRILSGVKLQSGVSSGEAIEWSDVSPSHGFIYDRGNASVRKGSVSFSFIYRNSSASNYYRLVLWKESSSNASTTAITLVNATSISITEQQ